MANFNKFNETMLNALCNASIMGESGVGIVYDKAKANSILESKGLNTNVCYEDKLMLLLENGHSIKFVDYEGGEDDSEYTVTVTLKAMHEKYSELINSNREDEIRKLMLDINDGNGDSCTAWDFIQNIIYGESIFG